MTVKIKFLNSVGQERFLHNLVNAKKRNLNYKHLYHRLINEAKDKVSFHISDENNNAVVFCEINFYPAENLVDIECQPCDFGKLQSFLIFDLLESINEKAVARFIDEKFYFDGSVDFYILIDGKKEIIRKVSSDRENLLEVTNARIIGQVMVEIKALDLI
ncbi:MAG: hypothetical protein WAV31_02840 [Candidatus Moraniibacteriota bacterium]